MKQLYLSQIPKKTPKPIYNLFQGKTEFTFVNTTCRFLYVWKKYSHIYICSDNKTILYVTYFEYLNTVDERFAYALNRIEKNCQSNHFTTGKMCYDVL